MREDVVVLGAGIVGISVALHLQQRGRSVALVDRRGAGEETSFGNAGLIERASLVPYSFPREWRALFRYATNLAPEAHYHPSFLPAIAPWLLRFWWHSAPRRLMQAAHDMRPLIERSLIEHEALIGQAGLEKFLRREGWIKAFRNPALFGKALIEGEKLKPYGISFDVLDEAGLRAREPHLSGFIGAIHWRDPATLSDPGAVVKGYADLFVRQGGRFVSGAANSLRGSGRDWVVDTIEGPLSAAQAVVALGPWSDLIFKPLGYPIPLAVKRGYHLHYEAGTGASLTHPVLDVEGGYVLAPMNRGIRLTTGVEFASRDAPPSPVQLARTEPAAREHFPLGRRLDANPWMGCRPCLPDMRPVIGPAPRHEGLWFAFGHNHHGLTLGPATGRLLAEMMAGETPFTDPWPYRADRF